MKLETEQDQIRAQIRSMMDASDLTATELARKAGLAPSTLTRFLNSDVKHLVSLKTMRKLSEALAVAMPLSVGGRVAPRPPYNPATEPGRDMNAELRQAVGWRMRQVLKARGGDLSDKKVADFLGWEETELRAYLNGSASIGMPRLREFCLRTGVSSDFILLNDRSRIDQPLREALESAQDEDSQQTDAS